MHTAGLLCTLSFTFGPLDSTSVRLSEEGFDKGFLESLWWWILGLESVCAVMGLKRSKVTSVRGALCSDEAELKLGVFLSSLFDSFSFLN